MGLAWPRVSLFPVCYRIRSWLLVPGQKLEPRWFLPAVMRERFVRFRHSVYVFLLLDRRAAVVGRVEQLVGELVLHALLGPRAAVADEPADGQRGAPVGIDLDGHLVVGAAHAPRLDLKQRLGVLDRLLEQLQRFVAALLLQLLHGAVEDGLRGALLAVPHHAADELVRQRRVVDRVRSDFLLRDVTFSRHTKVLSSRFSVLSQSWEQERSFLALGAVFRARLLAAGDADRVERAAHHVVANAGQVLYAAAADEHDRVLLQVVADARDVGGDLDPVGQAHAGNFAQRRVRLLGRLRVNAGANAALLRALLQGRRGRLVLRPGAAQANELVKCRHSEFSVLDSQFSATTPARTSRKRPDSLRIAARRLSRPY